MRKLIIGALASMAAMCSSFEPLSIERTTFAGESLKLNGYYYKIRDGKYNVFFLYRNGVYRGGVWEGILDGAANDMELLDSKVRGAFSSDVVPVRYDWGIFRVVAPNITIERWLSGVGQPYPTQLLEGDILNDSTIHFRKKIGDHSHGRGSKKHMYEINDIYHFRSFSPKADSASAFVR